MANCIDFPVSPTWGRHYRTQGLVVQEENQIDFSCSDTFQNYYHDRLLTPFHTPEPDQQERLVETVAALADEIHQLRRQLARRSAQQAPMPSQPIPIVYKPTVQQARPLKRLDLE